MQIRINLSLLTALIVVFAIVSCGGRTHQTDVQELGGGQIRSGSTTVAPTLVDYVAEDWNMYGFRFKDRRAGLNGPTCDGTVDVDGYESSWTIPGRVTSSPTSVITNPGTGSEDIGFFLLNDDSQLYFIEGLGGTPQLVYGNGTLAEALFGSSPAIDNQGNVFFLTTEIIGMSVVSALRVYVPATSTVYSSPVTMCTPTGFDRQMGSPIVINRGTTTEVYVGTLASTSTWTSILYRFDFDRSANTLTQTWARTVNGHVAGPAAYVAEGDGFIAYVAEPVLPPGGTLLHVVATDNSVYLQEVVTEHPIRNITNNLVTNYPVICTQFIGTRNELELIALAVNASGANGLNGRVRFYDLYYDTSLTPAAWVLNLEGMYAGTSSYWVAGPAAGMGEVHYVYQDPSDSIYLNRADGHVTCIDCGVYQEDIGWNLGYVSNRPLAIYNDVSAGTHFGYTAESQTCTVGRADYGGLRTDAVFRAAPTGAVQGVPMCSVNGNAYVPASYQLSGLWLTEMWMFNNP